MQVGVGFSDSPDTVRAGEEAAIAAVSRARQKEHCDLVLLFSTAAHEPAVLNSAVRSVVGSEARIYGGGAAGVITNETFGYAGSQVGLVCFWLSDGEMQAALVDGLSNNEEAAGARLGELLKRPDRGAQSPLLLFYDAVAKTENGMQLMMATYLLKGLEQTLGYRPDICGAGLQGDHAGTPYPLFADDELGYNHAVGFCFAENIQIRSAIMHGCRPATGYYTVTKADGPKILEIDGVPALDFLDGILGPALQPEDYPFFLLFGINHGEKWREYSEDSYASRLCLGIEPAERAVVMFEPDMAAGTRFQIMYRAMELDYIAPKIEALFAEVGEQEEAVFAMYIDCAGRCAGYGGTDLEDAYAVQQAVAKRVPLLGLYTGVEIAPLGGKPRGLDWTGVFCLFVQSRDGSAVPAHPSRPAVWEPAAAAAPAAAYQPTLADLNGLNEDNVRKILSLDLQSIRLRHEMEQKRRGFRLLAELSASLQKSSMTGSFFGSVATKINATLNMQRTVVLVPKGSTGLFVAQVLQGYTVAEKEQLAGRYIKVDRELILAREPVIVTAAAADEQRFKTLREALKLPYFIAATVRIQDKLEALLLTGRLSEQQPFLSRLSSGEAETVQALAALMSTVIVNQRLAAAEESTRIMQNATPQACLFWNERGRLTDCNRAALHLFGVADKAELLAQYDKLMPKYQQDKRLSEEVFKEYLMNAFYHGESRFEWLYKDLQGVRLPAQVTIVRVPRGEGYSMVGYLHDQREQQKALDEVKRAKELAEENVRIKNEFLTSISKEVQAPMNGILKMAQAVEDLTDFSEEARSQIDNGLHSVNMLMATINSILDYSNLEGGKIELEHKLFSLADLVNSVRNLWADEAERKGITLQYAIAPQTPYFAVGDEVRLQQALFNLVANAVQYTFEGGVRIQVRAEDVGYPGHLRFIFEIADTGIGIEPELQAELFLPITDKGVTHRGDKGGLGMGIAVTRSLAILMNGDIDLISEPGGGSTFSLSALLEIPRQETAAVPAAEVGEETYDFSGLQVLVAEDNLLNQMILKGILEKAGIVLVQAHNGVEAVKAVKKSHYDLVFMDVEMPEMDGLTATELIRRDEACAGLPIIGLVLSPSAEETAEYQRKGMNDQLEKPLEVRQVYEMIAKWRPQK